MASPESIAPGSPARAVSPWFARTAAGLLEEGKTQEALRVCLEGTRAFPRYATGHLILGRCYDLQGRHIEAKLEYRVVMEAFPDNHIVGGLVRNAEEREREAFQNFVTERLAKLQGRKDRLTFDDYIGTTSAGPATSVERIIRQLEEAPRRVPGAVRAPAPPPEAPAQEPREPAGRFVTATLAEIYASQGEYAEAIKAYRTLALQRPGSAERYQKRLAELEDLQRLQEGSEGARDRG